MGHYHRAITATAAVLTTFIVAVAAPLSAQIDGASQSSSRPEAVAAAAEPALPHWSPAEVSRLIAQIEASRDEGLDPSNYGLAALKGERLHTVEFLGRRTSRQLDELADAAALALARDVAANHAEQAAQSDAAPARGVAL